MGPSSPCAAWLLQAVEETNAPGTAGASTGAGVGGASPSEKDPSDGGGAGEGPRSLWRAEPLTREFRDVAATIDVGAVATGSGIGLALLGVAPFTPPNPFMVALLLTILQVRIAHVWMVRQLQSQLRRNVVEVELLKGSVDRTEDALRVKFVCDGGLTRTFDLVSPATDNQKPSFAEVLQGSANFFFIDEASGKTDDKRALEALLKSDRVIDREEFRVVPLEGEDQDTANKTVQTLSSLTPEKLKAQLANKEVSAAEMLGQMRRTAQLSGALILTGGLVICLGGRHSANVTLQSGGPAPRA